MRWLRNNWKTLLLAAVGIAAMVTLTLIILDRRKDVGFKVVPCSKRDPTKGFGPARWNRNDVPLAIYVDELATDQTPFIAEAVDFWEKRTDMDLFMTPAALTPGARAKCTESGPGPSDPVVLVTRTNAADSHDYDSEGLPGALYWDATCRLRCVELRFPGNALPERWTRIARHEMGHMLGLDDAVFEGAVMHHDLQWVGEKITPAEMRDIKASYAK